MIEELTVVRIGLSNDCIINFNAICCMSKLREKRELFLWDTLQRQITTSIAVTS